MIKSFLKIAYRSLFKNRLSSFINIFGLSMAVGCTIVIFLVVDFMYNIDSFHEYAENILDTAAYHMPLGPIPFIVTSGLIIFTAVLTIFSQVYKGAATNPVEYLRHE